LFVFFFFTVFHPHFYFTTCTQYFCAVGVLTGFPKEFFFFFVLPGDFSRSFCPPCCSFLFFGCKSSRRVVGFSPPTPSAIASFWCAFFCFQGTSCVLLDSYPLLSPLSRMLAQGSPNGQRFFFLHALLCRYPFFYENIFPLYELFFDSFSSFSTTPASHLSNVCCADLFDSEKVLTLSGPGFLRFPLLLDRHDSDFFVCFFFLVVRLQGRIRDGRLALFSYPVRLSCPPGETDVSLSSRGWARMSSCPEAYRLVTALSTSQQSPFFLPFTFQSAYNNARFYLPL